MLNGQAWASLSVDSFSAATNDRFADNGSFFASGYDLSGMGRDPDVALTGYSGGHWAVMVSRNVFLTAQHYNPWVGKDLVFYTGNDPTAQAITRTIAGAQQIGGTDLRIGYLDSALPTSVKTYGFSTTPLSEATFGVSSFNGNQVILTGISPTTSGYGASEVTNAAHGQNRLEGFFSNYTISGATGDSLLTVKNQPGDGTYGYSYVTHEADVNGGDSGSALFRIVGGDLEVAGIAWASGTGNIAPSGLPPEVRDISLYTYTGSYASDIQGYIDLHAVPEPSTVLLGGVALMLLGGRRR